MKKTVFYLFAFLLVILSSYLKAYEIGYRVWPDTGCYKSKSAACRVHMGKVAGVQIVRGNSINIISRFSGTSGNQCLLRGPQYNKMTEELMNSNALISAPSLDTCGITTPYSNRCEAGEFKALDIEYGDSGQIDSPICIGGCAYVLQTSVFIADHIGWKGMAVSNGAECSGTTGGITDITGPTKECYDDTHNLEFCLAGDHEYDGDPNDNCWGNGTHCPEDDDDDGDGEGGGGGAGGSGGTGTSTGGGGGAGGGDGDGNEESDFCKQNPTHPLCKKESVSGVCNTQTGVMQGFSCKGNVVECALLKSELELGCIEKARQSKIDALANDFNNYSEADARQKVFREIDLSESLTVTLQGEAFLDSCSAIEDMTFAFAGNHSISFQPFIDLAATLKPVLSAIGIFLAGVFAVRIGFN